MAHDRRNHVGERARPTGLGRASPSAPVVALVGVLASLVACIPTYTFGDGGTEDASPDGKVSVDAHAPRDSSTGADGTVDARHDSMQAADAGAEAAKDGALEGPLDSAHPFDAAKDAAIDTAHDAAGEASHAFDAGEDAARDASTHDARDASTAVPDAATDAPQDSPNVVASGGDGGVLSGSLSPFTVVADAGSNAYPVGYGEQLHSVYAMTSNTYWLFYPGPTNTQISTAISTAAKPTMFTAGPSITVPDGYALTDGYSFSVAYTNLGAEDVVHFVADGTTAGNYQAIHFRAAISGTSLAVTPGSVVSLATTTKGGSCTNDGPATVVASDGTVYDVTAWTDHSAQDTSCDTDVYTSTSKENGTLFPTSFTYSGYYVSNPGYDYSHALVGLRTSPSVLVAFPDQDNAALSDFGSMGWAFSSTFTIAKTFLSPSVELFTSLDMLNSVDDWAACVMSDTDVRIVRHVTASAGGDPTTFEEADYNGTAWSISASPPPDVTSGVDTGLVLLNSSASPGTMLVATIDTSGSIEVARSTAAGRWSTNLASTGAHRQSLSGSGCVQSPRPLIFWTEPTATGSSSFKIMGADLTSLL